MTKYSEYHKNVWPPEIFVLKVNNSPFSAKNYKKASRNQNNINVFVYLSILDLYWSCDIFAVCSMLLWIMGSNYRPNALQFAATLKAAYFRQKVEISSFCARRVKMLALSLQLLQNYTNFTSQPRLNFSEQYSITVLQTGNKKANVM